MKEFGGPVPKHLKQLWTPGTWTIHTFGWWRDHWNRTGLVDIELADAMPNGFHCWSEWNLAYDDLADWYSKMLEEDQGEYLGYVRMVARRKPDVALDEHCWPDTLRSLPVTYKQSVLNDEMPD